MPGAVRILAFARELAVALAWREGEPRGPTVLVAHQNVLEQRNRMEPGCSAFFVVDRHGQGVVGPSFDGDSHHPRGEVNDDPVAAADRQCPSVASFHDSERRVAFVASDVEVGFREHGVGSDRNICNRPVPDCHVIEANTPDRRRVSHDRCRAQDREHAEYTKFPHGSEPPASFVGREPTTRGERKALSLHQTDPQDCTPFTSSLTSADESASAHVSVNPRPTGRPRAALIQGRAALGPMLWAWAPGGEPDRA